MAGKRSLEIILSFRDRAMVSDILERQGIEVAEARSDFIQVRNTTPTEIRRLTRGFKLNSIRDGFRRR
jgi:hypothetical protein